jgi:hypothetical protein
MFPSSEKDTIPPAAGLPYFLFFFFVILKPRVD